MLDIYALHMEPPEIMGVKPVASNFTDGEGMVLFSSGSLCADAPKSTAGIYGIKNHATGKWYVGQASVGVRSKGVRNRMQAYLLLRCKKQREIYKSLKYYGLLSHSAYILEQCTADRLNEREIAWIKKMKSQYPKGYNLTGGG